MEGVWRVRFSPGQWAGMARRFFGVRCRVCGRVLEDPGAELCSACATALAARTGGFCPLCGELFSDPCAPPHLCTECLTTGRPWSGFCFHSVYAGELRRLILGFKFRSALGSTILLSSMLTEAVVRAGMTGDFVVVPVPMHSERIRRRGYNQALELARNLSRRMGRRLYPKVLRRVRPTRPQAGLSRVSRENNLFQAFEAFLPDSGCRVLLVDDVMTTGSTLDSCTRALLDKGAVEVHVAVLARAAKLSLDFSL